MKIVINGCFGGFGLSHKAVMRYAELKGLSLYPWIDDISKKVYKARATLDNPCICIHYTTVPQDEYKEIVAEETEKPIVVGRFSRSNALYFYERDIDRTDPTLLQVIEEMRDEANGRCSKLKIIEIPDGIEWEIKEYDGNEYVAEKHKRWG